MSKNWQRVKESLPCKVSSTSTADVREAYGVTQEHGSSTELSCGCHSAGMPNKSRLPSPSLTDKLRSTQTDQKSGFPPLCDSRAIL